jgi:hypothetical protein
MDQRYKGGREIHAGDRVTYNKQSGRIAFVADRGEFTKGYECKEYTEGFMIEFDNGARLLLQVADDLLVFQGTNS